MTLFKKLNDAKEGVFKQVKMIANKPYLEAAIGASVYIAMADGEFCKDEKKKLMSFLCHSDELSAFKATDVVASCDELVKMFAFDVDIAKGECLRRIVKIKGNSEYSMLIRSLVVSIGKSDGDFDPDEKKAADEIVDALGVTRI